MVIGMMACGVMFITQLLFMLITIQTTHMTEGGSLEMVTLVFTFISIKLQFNF